MRQSYEPDRVLLKLECLSKSYRTDGGELPVLREVSLSVCRGEFVAMMGASGSGKSTLLNVLGLLDGYDSGRYLLDGQETRGLREVAAAALRNRSIGFVFQSFHLLPHKRAWENVALPLRYAGAPGKEQKRRALAVLDRLGLSHRADHRPSELSGGQRQRVAIARALVTDPPLVLADEPTGNLDSETGQEVLQVLKQIHAEGRTLVLVTHDPGVARSAERVICMRDGRLVSDESLELAGAS
jgi:putative ABC transport system ATP-binding protein